jgi:GT2 family glycosyltransferase
VPLATDPTNAAPPAKHSTTVKISIIIKTLNEEANIARAIESALVAAAPHGGEVIVADSGSKDRTVEIAMGYPTLVVQLENFDERCCGVGPQLGYQHSSGEYVYVLDGDMQLDAGFLRQALELLEHQPSIAAVGGLTREMRVRNIEFKNRGRHFLNRQVEDGSEVECLVGGGLYRRRAIEDVGYLSDRNLHGFEEYDLGARLRQKGWRVVRINTYAVDHYSYQLGTYRLLWYRVRAGRLLALGEILRAGAREGYMRRAVVELRPIRFALGTLLFWIITGLLASMAPTTAWLIVFLAIAATLPVVAMAARSGSIAAGTYSVVIWHLTAVALLLGLARPRKPPAATIACRIRPTAATTVGGVPSSEHKLRADTARGQVEPVTGGAGPAPAGRTGYCGSAS